MNQPINHKVWLITGCSTGFRRVIAEAAEERGDRVVCLTSPANAKRTERGIRFTQPATWATFRG